MIADDPGPAADSPPGPGEDDPAAPGPPAPGDDTDSPEASEHIPGNDLDDFAQTATVINNFFAEVDAHTIGVAGSHQPFARPAIRRESGMLAAAEVTQALRYYIEPAPFRQALQILSTRHLVALAGAQGCGKKAGTMALARAACPGGQSLTVFPPTRSLQELAAYKKYRAGQVYLIHDWMPVSGDPASVASYDLQQLAVRLRKADACLAITFEGGGRLHALLGEMCVRWSSPDPHALLDARMAGLPDLRPSDAEREQLRARATEIRSPRLVIKLAETAARGVAAALADASENENSAVAEWFASAPPRWQVRAVTALTFLSGVGERKFERLQAGLAAATPPSHAESPDSEHREIPGDEDPFPQSRWALANDARLGEFLTERDCAAPVGSEHRPAFRTRACRQHFMTELNRRFGDELWTPVRDWLFTLADQPFGEAQIAAGYGLALLARCALGEVEAAYLRPWSAGSLQNRLMAVSVLWAMAEDDLLVPAALRIVVSWVRNQGQERAITAAIAFGGPLGQRHPSEAMRWLWVLSQRSERVRRVARTAMSQLFAAEAEADLEKGTVVRFLLQKIRPLLQPDATVRERRAALAVANSVLDATQALSDAPVMASVLRRRPADLQPAGELWAAALNSLPHRRDAVRALHRTLATLAEDADSVSLARGLGRVIMPRLTGRAAQVLQLTLPDPIRAEKISASVVAAFLGAHQQAIGAIT